MVTKTAKQPDVYEFVMDEVEFERRAKTNAAMFKDNIKLRNAGNGKQGVSTGSVRLVETLSKAFRGGNGEKIFPDAGCLNMVGM